MQNFSIFDIVIVSITVLLGLKGLMRGFIKEVFGLVGIIGGIFVASRIAGEVGKAIAPVLALENQATINLIGFVLGLVGFWAVIYVLGIILSRIFSASGLGIFDRILGFFFGSAKIFLIFSVITYGVYQLQSFKDLLDKKIGNAVTFPFLVKTGGFIVKLDASDFVKKVEEKITPTEDIEEQPDMVEKKSFVKEVSETVEKIKDTTVKSGTTVVDTMKKTVNDKVDKIVDTVKETSNLTTEELTNTNKEEIKEAVKEEASKMTEETTQGN